MHINKSYIKNKVREILHIPLILFTAFLCLIIPRKKNQLIWGPTPIISNQYWSEAMRQVGWNSIALMSTSPKVRRAKNQGLYFDDLVPKWIKPWWLKDDSAACAAMLYIIRHAKVVHLFFQGGPLGQTALWWLEAYLFRWAGIQTIVMPYGGDAYMYSLVVNPSLRHGLLTHWPHIAKQESKITQRVNYWTRHANIMLTGLMVDGMGRWDVPVYNMICIDSKEWLPKSVYSSYDGRNGPVKVIHTPNHRGFKGTEFLIQAVEELQQEGLQVELTLLEGVPNSRVRQLIQEMDILAEQFIVGYALSGIEGMVSGLPVLSNLEHDIHTQFFRRYAYLNECPIVSTAPETIKQNLRALVTHPELREELGRAGRKYVDKYHSYTTTQYLFGSIYEQILHDKDVDLMNLFHPLKSEYKHKTPVVEHPLVKSHLPVKYLDTNS